MITDGHKYRKQQPYCLPFHCTLTCLLLAAWAPLACASSQPTARPNYRSLGLLGQELLSKVEHATKPQPGQTDPYTQMWPNTIAVCALMKDENADDVKEFIAYHRWVGVDKFYLRENGNRSAIRETLEPYIEKGIVDFGLLDGPKHPTQTNWYNACSKEAQKLHSWVAFIDLDEFIVILNKMESVTRRGALKQVLRQSFRYTAAVSMQWVLFGSGGHQRRPSEGQLKGFNRCDGQLSKQMKCLGNSFWFHYRATFRPTHVHQCNFRFGAVAVMGDSQPLDMWRVKMIPGPGNEGPYGASNAGHMSPHEHSLFKTITNTHQIALFHYVTRAQSDFIERKIAMRSGKYATEFAAIANSTGLGGDMGAVYAAFEKKNGFDGEHNICHQGAALHDAIEDARLNGWSELDEQ